MGQIRENIKKNLGYYLTLRGISQKEFAEKLGVSQSSVTCWIKGKNSPDIEVVAQICDILKISVTDLFGTDNAKINPRTQQAAALFKQLNPSFQKYALDQIEKLLELQLTELAEEENQKAKEEERKLLEGSTHIVFTAASGGDGVESTILTEEEDKRAEQAEREMLEKFNKKNGYL